MTKLLTFYKDQGEIENFISLRNEILTKIFFYFFFLFSIPQKKLNRILQRAQDAALDSGSVKQKDKRLEVLDELGKLYFTAKTDIYPKDQVSSFKPKRKGTSIHGKYQSLFMMKCHL